MGLFLNEFYTIGLVDPDDGIKEAGYGCYDLVVVDHQKDQAIREPGHQKPRIFVK